MSGCYEFLIGEYVKVSFVSGKNPVYGLLIAEDDHTINLRFRNGEVLVFGKAGVERCSSWVFKEK